MCDTELSIFIKLYFNKLFGNATITEPERITKGLSGAQVFRIKLISDSQNEHSGWYIVKIIDSENTRGIFKDEYETAKKMYSNAGVDFRQHLVEAVKSDDIDGKRIIIYKQANNGIRYNVDFSELGISKRNTYADKISQDILNLWNNKSVKPIAVSNNIDFFASLLGWRLNMCGRFESYTLEIIF